MARLDCSERPIFSVCCWFRRGNRGDGADGDVLVQKEEALSAAVRKQSTSAECSFAAGQRAGRSSTHATPILIMNAKRKQEL